MEQDGMKLNKTLKNKMRGGILIELLIACAILGITFGAFAFKTAELQKYFNLSQSKIARTFALLQAANIISATNSGVAIDVINNNQIRDDAKITGQCSVNACEISTIIEADKSYINIKLLENL